MSSTRSLDSVETLAVKPPARVSIPRGGAPGAPGPGDDRGSCPAATPGRQKVKDASGDGVPAAVSEGDREVSAGVVHGVAVPPKGDVILPATGGEVVVPTPPVPDA